ncbi:HPr family phosphocarrier protein [Sanguibacter sp. A247]|uniref:HPr family phosphocarrier protein n=1 Tax=unclassified Sanguibacter TaxID=2645534 RepID=UPI003FD6FC58
MERTVTVAILEGLHARPAALFAQEAGKQAVPVTIARGTEDPVDASSVLGVMTLGANVGEVVTLHTDTDGDDATAALDALEAFLLQETI